MKVSIITVTYNAAACVERTLKSVFAQTYRAFEYIVIDGASQDGTQAIVQRYAAGIAHWLSEPDNGIYDAMNKGLVRATGNYVCFLNAGDTFYDERTLAQVAAAAEQHTVPPAVIYGETDIVDAQGRFLAKRRLRAPAMLTWRDFRMGMMVCHQAFFVDRSVAPQYDLGYRYSADFDWCLRILKAAVAVRICNSHRTLICYQCEGTTTSHRWESLVERYRIMCKYYGTLPTMVRHIWFAVRFCWARCRRKYVV
jgi:glycosyltransferase involved in cell wall biosynthesis